MTIKKLSTHVLVALVALAVTYGVARADLLINGAGSTFGYPIYSKWFSEYHKDHPNLSFNYQSIGSGGGIRMLMDKTVEIGASDAPLSDAQMKSAPGPVLHFPTVLGAVAITYNLPGVTKELRFTGPLIADIFMAKVKKWNDPAIEKINPGVTLPDQPISVVHRSDGSGDTYIFADYLTKASPGWAKEVGRGTSLKWPTGLGGKGNEGVTALVRETPYAIGYVTLIYALETHMPVGVVENHDGDWIKPSLGSVTAAAAGASADMPKDFRVSITNAPGKDSYPISSFTWMIVYVHQQDREKGVALKGFLHWMLHKGQADAGPMNYAPLPSAVVKMEEAQIKEIKLPK
jgi:phosphate transport system substrate-binding protein